MNQQRSRRFRTAKEAREVREKAESKGEKLPDAKAFDSNCITPGELARYFCTLHINEGHGRNTIYGAPLGTAGVLHQ